MKQYFLILLLITPLHAGRLSAEDRLKHALEESPRIHKRKSPPSSAKKQSVRPATPFPHSALALMQPLPSSLETSYDQTDIDTSLTPAPPIPETSILASRRQKKPFNRDHKKTVPPIERPATRRYKKIKECAQCTASYCQGKGWCDEHK